MAIATMGVRSALRTEQDRLEAQYKNVVEALALAPEAGTSTSPLPSFSGAPKTTTPGDNLTTLLEKLAAWIPAEILAAWTIFALAVDLYKTTIIELLAAIVATISTGIYAFLASKAAHNRRQIDTSNSKAIKTGLMASFSFLAYWIATPGSLVTADWGWPVAIPVGIALLTVLFLPFVAQLLKIEPITS